MRARAACVRVLQVVPTRIGRDLHPLAGPWASGGAWRPSASPAAGRVSGLLEEDEEEDDEQDEEEEEGGWEEPEVRHLVLTWWVPPATKEEAAPCWQEGTALLVSAGRISACSLASVHSSQAPPSLAECSPWHQQPFFRAAACCCLALPQAAHGLEQRHVRQVAAGRHFSVALDDQGQVRAWLTLHAPSLPPLRPGTLRQSQALTCQTLAVRPVNRCGRGARASTAPSATTTAGSPAPRCAMLSLSPCTRAEESAPHRDARALSPKP